MNTSVAAPSRRPANRLRQGLALVAGVLVLGVFALSLYEVWLLNFGPDTLGYSMVAGDVQQLAASDARSAFLELNPATNTHYPTNLLQLFATDTPGVISTTQAAQLSPPELLSVAVRQSALSDDADYRVYPLGADTVPMRYDREANGVVLRIFPQAGSWPPGTYIVDIPTNGTEGGRDYYQFIVDAAK